MTLHRSKAYDRIHDETRDQFKPNDLESVERVDQHWLKTVAPKWIARVGMPRLIAEAVLAEVSGLLRSLNPGLFRNDPRGSARLRSAQDAASGLYQYVAQENWRRFDAKEKK